MTTISAFKSHRRLFQAIEEGHLELVQQFLDAGMCVDQADDEGLTLLMLATRDRRGDILTELLRRGASLEQTNAEGDNALAWAAMEGYADGVALLLQAGANPRAVNEDGYSALHWGALDAEQEDAQRETEKCAQLILDAGVPVDFRVNQGNTPFMESVETNSFAMARFFLAHGAQINALSTCAITGETADALQRQLLFHESLGWMTPDERTFIRDEKAEETCQRMIDFLLENGARNNALENGWRTSDLARRQGLEQVAARLEDPAASPAIEPPQKRAALRLVR